MGLAIIEPYQYSEYSGYDNLKKFIYRAIVPLIVIWGFVWVKKSINEASI